MILLTSIWHCGTHSRLEEIPDHARKLQSGEVIQCHCNTDALKHAEKADQILMTFRNPYRVAASWVNRGRLPKLPHQRNRTWCEQWRIWAELVPRAHEVRSVDDLKHRLNTHVDEHGLHAMIAAGDYGLFHAYVPRELIKFAYEQMARVYRYLPDETMTG